MSNIFRTLKSQDLTTKALSLAIFYSGFWIAIHWLYTQPSVNPTWVFPQFLSSLLIFVCLNGLFISFNYYRYGWIGKVFASIFYFQPVFQIGYFHTYKAFLEQQNISLLLREPNFILNLAVKEISILRAVVLILMIGIFYFLNQWLLGSKKELNSSPKPYFFFHSKWFLLFLVIAIGTQIKWCLKHDTSQLTMRPFYPIAGFAFLSVAIFLFRTQRDIFKKTFWILLLSMNVTQLYALNLRFPDFRDRMSLDSRYYRALFGAYFVNTALDTLDQSDMAYDKLAKLPEVKMDYNILLILDDSQRWDFSERHGYPRETDRKLNWFYDQAYDFQFPVSSANFTDTSVPALLTGIGSNRDVLEIKGNLTIWDYFSKGTNTFFMTTQILNWSRLDLFYNSIGQKHLWSTVGNSGFKDNSERADDSYLVKEFSRFAAEKKSKGENWVGTLQMFSSHYPYNAYPGAPQPYKPCDLTRASGPEPFINCYANGQISAAWAKDEVLKAADLENTVVFMTSDHGEGFNEHGIWFHGVDYHQEMVKVPLFVYLPPKIKKKIPVELLKNLEENTKGIVSTLDIAPTILHIHELVTGQKLEQGAPFSGHSLLESSKDRLVFSSHCFPQYRCYSREIAFVNKDYYLLFRPSEGFYRIYDTFGDLKQTQPIDPKSIPQEKLDKLVEDASHLHSIGQSMKSYYETFQMDPAKK